MSFLGGPECSTAANPLSQFTKHVQDDKSLQRDRLVGRGQGGMGESMRSQPVGPGPQDPMMAEFIQGPAQMPSFANLEQMRGELAQIDMTARARESASPQTWAGEFDPGIPDHAHAAMDGAFSRPTNGGFSPADFARFQHQKVQNARAASPMSAAGQQTLMQGYRPMMNYGGYGSMGMGVGMGMQSQFTPSYAQQQPMTQNQQDKGKGKERMVELDDNEWESQFASLEQTDQHHGIDAEANEKMEEELSAMDRNMIGEERFDLGDQDALDQWEGFDGLNTHRDPSLGDYIFEGENPFQTLNDPFTEGQKIMADGGNLSLAALAFEAAVQKSPSHTEAWTALGQAQAQNEKESPAIRALEQALKVDPSNLDALMSLAVSYTNEGYDSTAYRTLERWLSTKYPQLVSPDHLSSAADVGFTDRTLLHEKVTDLFINAAQLSPTGEQMDPDVQVGLGVLFYGAEEYDKAVDCFGAALASTEEGSTNKSGELHLLWNRLGATLANSGRSEEAIDAYSRALEIRPNFVRARYNLGVSCINIGCFEEAAQHLLGALAMHKVVEQEGLERVREVTGGEGSGITDAKLEQMILQNQSTNLYDTLRRVFAQMDRRDLQELVGPGMDLDKMRTQFEF